MNGSEEPLDYSDLQHDILLAPKKIRVITKKHSDDQELSDENVE
jgi:hypothetical protein